MQFCKRFALPVLLLILAAALGGCSAIRGTPLPESTAIPGTDPVYPSAVDINTMDLRGCATLWFRFLDEPYLAAETRSITQLAGQSYEYALLSALFAGPGTQQVEMTSLFPVGTRVLSTLQQGRTMIITLSGEFTGMLPDEPETWYEDAFWQAEIPLRRKLAMQSIVATVTDNCDADEVVILVEQGSAVSDSLRLRQSWFMDGADESVLTGPQTRDDTLLLTPATTGERFLDYWRQKNWSALYKYIAATDVRTGIAKPEYRAFVTEMERFPALMDVHFNGCSVFYDGSVATVSADINLQQPSGQTAEIPSRIFRLHRQDGIWKICMSDLVDWLEE